MPPVVQIFELVHVLAASFLLVDAAHVLGLPVRQLIVRDGFLVLVPDGRLVVDVDIALDVATGRLWRDGENTRCSELWWVLGELKTVLEKK